MNCNQFKLSSIMNKTIKLHAIKIIKPKLQNFSTEKPNQAKNSNVVKKFNKKKKRKRSFSNFQIQINFSFLSIFPHFAFNPYKLNQPNQLNRIEYNAILLQKQFNHHNVLVEDSIN